MRVFHAMRFVPRGLHGAPLLLHDSVGGGMRGEREREGEGRERGRERERRKTDVVRPGREGGRNGPKKKKQSSQQQQQQQPKKISPLDT